MRGGGSSSSSRRPGTRDFSPNPSDMKDNNHHHHHHRSERPHRNNPFPHRPPPRRSLTPPSRARPSRERRDHAPFAEEDNYSFQTARKYMLDRQADPALPHSKPSLTETEYRHPGISALPSASSGHRGQGLLTHSSIFMDDGAARKFYTDTGYLSSTAAAAALKSENLGGGGFHESDVLRYHDRPRDPYDERDKEKIHTKDTSYSLISSSTRGRAFGGTSSSSLAKDDLLELYRDRPHHPSDGFSRDFGVTKLSGDPLEHRGFGMSRLSDDPLEARGFGASKLPDDLMERNGYGQGLISDPVRRAPLSPTVRYAPQDYTYYDLDRSKTRDQGFLAADNAYKKAESGNRGDFKSTLNSTSFMNLAGDRGERANASHKNSTESSLWDRHRSLHGDMSLDYRDTRTVREDYVRGFGSVRDASRVKLSRDNEVALFEDRYALTREGAMSMAYREIPRSPLHGVSHMDNRDMYDLSPERMVRGKYGMDDDAYQIDSPDVFPNDRSAFRRLRSPSGSDELRTIKDRLEFPPSKRPFYKQRQRRMPANRMPRSDGRLQYADSSAHAGRGRGISLKRRLRPGPSEFHGSFSFESRNDFNKPNKFWKRDVDYHHANQDAQHEHTYDDPSPPVLKTDPPEDSEEFKHQVQKAFLRYSKVLNENPHQQKKYLEQGKAGSLVCCVCGSLSKEFMDTHSLVMHTYNSLKVGLKTKHRGLHKALCTLMGWNWLVPPGSTKIYQSGPVAEAKALKEDLILWPPVVIVHNSSIGNKINANGAKVMTIEGMAEILRDMGFEAEKTQVCQGKPANQNVLLVKFMPTFSGLQEAERLHKHYADNRRGKQEFHQITSHSDDKAKEAHVEKVEELLYGYMAVAEDLDKLDPGTKKRCLVKSRKDIKAIADAPLNMD